MKISIVTVCKNSEDSIERAIQSVVSQTATEAIEYIIIDGASDDRTLEIIDRYRPQIDRLVSEPDAGVYAAMNKGLNLAAGDFVYFLNSDDYFIDSSVIADVVNFIEKSPDCDLVYGDLDARDVNQNYVYSIVHPAPEMLMERMIWGWIYHQGVFARRSLFDRFGNFDEKYRISADHHWLFKVLESDAKIQRLPRKIASYWLGGISAKPERQSEALQEIFAVQNQVKTYQESEWMHRRLLKFQSVIIELNAEVVKYRQRSSFRKLSFWKSKVNKLLFGRVAESINSRDRIKSTNIDREWISNKTQPRIAIDGVFFQLYNTGIARVWRSLLQEWVASGFADRIVVLDRQGTAPKLDGIKYFNIDAYSFDTAAADSQMLQSVCDDLQVDLFLSTYYTTPLSTPSVLLVHDMIPEVISADLSEPVWQEKQYAIALACRYIAVSQNTAKDLQHFYPQIPSELVSIAYNGVSPEFFPASELEIEQFRSKYQIEREYFLLVGSRSSLNGYKNAILFFKAFKELDNNRDIAIVCVGGGAKLEPELAALTRGTKVHLVKLDDVELRLAFAGAIALVYPSLYEGFGLPIVEAMACGCPVITCHNSSIPEVASNAALYVGESNVNEMKLALNKVREPAWRSPAIPMGIAQSEHFSWQQMAQTIEEILSIAINEQKNARDAWHTSLVWQEFRRLQARTQPQHSFSPLDPTSPMSRLSISKLTPFISLLAGFVLLVLVNGWQEYLLAIGGDLLALSLAIGVIGYYNYIDALKLRNYRIILATGGLLSIGWGIVHFYIRRSI